MAQPSSKQWPIALAVAAPLLWTLFLAIHGGRIPHQDYWDMQEAFFSPNGFSAQASDWFTATRAHLMPLTYLAYAANIALTAGSNLGLVLLTAGLAAMQLILLARLARRSGLGDWWLPVVAVFTFTPCAAELWMRGFSGVPNAGAQSLAVASIYCLAGCSQDDRPRHRVLGLCLALLSGLTFSTGLPACLVAIVALSWPGRVRWRWGLAAAASAACLFALRSSMVEAFYAPGAPPAIRLPDPIEALRYALPLIGGIFSQKIEIAGALSAAGISLASVAAWQERANPRSRPWILLLLLTLGQGALITVGRWDQGAAQAIASRYAPVAALFWLSALSLVALRLRGRGARFALGVAVLALTAAMSAVGWRYDRTLLHRASLQTAATLSIQYDVADQDAIRISITPWTHQLMRNLPTLEARDLVPFDRPLAAEWGTQIEGAGLAQPQIDSSSTLGLHRFRERGIRMMAFQPDADGRLVLVNESGRLRGSALPLRFAPYRAVVWVGYARVTEADRTLRVVRIPERGPPVELREVALERMELDKRGLRIFESIRELPRVHRAGRSLF